MPVPGETIVNSPTKQQTPQQQTSLPPKNNQPMNKVETPQKPQQQTQQPQTGNMANAGNPVKTQPGTPVAQGNKQGGGPNQNEAKKGNNNNNNNSKQINNNNNKAGQNNNNANKNQNDGNSHNKGNNQNQKNGNNQSNNNKHSNDKGRFSINNTNSNNTKGPFDKNKLNASKNDSHFSKNNSGSKYHQNGNANSSANYYQMDATPQAEKKFTGRCRLFCGNLPSDMTEAEFKELFKKFGETGECFLNTQRSFGFIKLDTRINAEHAKQELDGTAFKGRTIRVRFATHGAAVKVSQLYSKYSAIWAWVWVAHTPTHTQNLTPKGT